jgi:pimeloyl-ACP methyl ester carboxylesterase
MGGRIAIEFALRNPERVGRLVLVSSAARVIRSCRRRLLMSVIPRLPIFKGRYPQPYRAFARQRDASGAYDGTARLPQVRAPTLILNGRRDTVAPFQLAEEMHASIPGSKILGFDGGHLFFMFRDRAGFFAAVGEFLRAGP